MDVICRVGLLGVENKHIDSCRSGIGNVGTGALDANGNLMLMDWIPYPIVLGRRTKQ